MATIVSRASSKAASKASAVSAHSNMVLTPAELPCSGSAAGFADGDWRACVWKSGARTGRAALGVMLSGLDTLIVDLGADIAGEGPSASVSIAVSRALICANSLERHEPPPAFFDVVSIATVTTTNISIAIITATDISTAAAVDFGPDIEQCFCGSHGRLRLCQKGSTQGKHCAKSH